MRLLLVSGCLLLGFLSQAQGNVDGFFKSKGDLDVALSGTYVYSRVYFAGTSPITYKRDQSIIGAYGVYGLNDKWNCIVSLPVINYKAQDLALFAKYKLFYREIEGGDFTVAPAFGLSFPVANYDTESGQAIGQKAFTLQPKLVVQFKSFQNWFVQIQTGYNYSFNPVPSSYSASAKVGYIYQNWYFDAWYDYQLGIGGKNFGSGNVNSFRELGVSYERVGGVIYVSMGKRIGAFVGVSTILSGRNIGDANAFNAGVVLKFNTNKEE